LSEGLAGWITATTGYAPADLNLFERALTHGSQGAENYERLEFLGDRVLGLIMAEWLTELFPGEADSDQLPAYAGAGTVWLVPRDDPNAGIAPAQRPIRRDGAGYQEVPDCYDRFAMEHLGGTLMDPDDSAAGDLSPFYFEIISLGGFDFAASRTLAFDLGVDDPLAWDRW